MAESNAPSQAQDAGQHKESDSLPPKSIVLTDAAGESTLSGQPGSRGVVSEAGYGALTQTKSPWQRGAYWRHFGMACSLQGILVMLLISTTLSYMEFDTTQSREEVKLEVEVVDGKGEVQIPPDADVRLTRFSKSDLSAYYGTNAWHQNHLWLENDVTPSSVYDLVYGHTPVDWNHDTPRTVMIPYAQMAFNGTAVEVSNDWANRSMLITTNLWLNHSNTTVYLNLLSTLGKIEQLVPVNTSEGWKVNYTATRLDEPCDFGYIEVLAPYVGLEGDEMARLTVHMENCSSSSPDAIEHTFGLQTNRYGIEVGGWAPGNSTLWFDHEQLGNTTLNLALVFVSVVAWEEEERRWEAYATTLNLAPVVLLLGLPSIAVFGGLRKGRSAAWGGITGFAVMPISFGFWLWANLVIW